MIIYIIVILDTDRAHNVDFEKVIHILLKELVSRDYIK